MRTPGLPLLYFWSVAILKTNILQHSVATLFSCGEICNGGFIANFLPSEPVKEFLKSVNVW